MSLDPLRCNSKSNYAIVLYGPSPLPSPQRGEGAHLHRQPTIFSLSLDGRGQG